VQVAPTEAAAGGARRVLRAQTRSAEPGAEVLGQQAQPAPVRSARRTGAASKLLVVRLLVVTVVVVAAVVLVARAVSTSVGRVSASTTSEGVLSAATLSLDRAGDSATVLFDAAGLYPGRIERGCVVVAYDGSIPARLTVSGVRRGGSGLERFIDLRLVALPTADCAFADDTRSDARQVFSGLLSELWPASGRDGRAALVGLIDPGDRVALVATASVVDDNRAQGRTTDFEFVVEARPA
jgi:hypothetical protein